jgi:predicted metal-binding membrane protein
MESASSFTAVRCRDFLWRHPEFPVLLLSAGAWLFLLAEPFARTGAPMAHPGHGGAMLSLPESWPALLLYWSIMLAAMMFPSLVPQVRLVAMRSFWSRRQRAITLFLAGYSVVWVLYAVLAELVLAGLQLAWSPLVRYVVPLSLLLAALWQLTPQKRRSLVACHFTMPLAPAGWRADLDCSQYGVKTAWHCLVSCWALMLICAVAGHALWAMFVVTLMALSERVVRRPRRLSFAAAVFCAVLAAAWQFWA